MDSRIMICKDLQDLGASLSRDKAPYATAVRCATVPVSLYTRSQLSTKYFTVFAGHCLQFIDFSTLFAHLQLVKEKLISAS